MNIYKQIISITVINFFLISGVLFAQSDSTEQELEEVREEMSQKLQAETEEEPVAEEAVEPAANYTNKLFIGYKGMDFKIEGYKNAVFNDYHRFPGAPGATYLNFEKGNTDVSSILQIGYAYVHNREHEFVFDFVYGSNDSSSVSIFSFGYNYVFSLGGKLSLFGGGGLGYATISNEIGEIESYGTLPITLEEGAFYEGAKIESSASGLLLEARVGVNYDITPEVPAYLALSFVSGTLDDVKTTVDGVEIEDEQAFDQGVLTGNSVAYEPTSNIDPTADVEVTSSSVVISAGVGYRF